MIFLCTGLGGGTGSGAAPVVAQLARETGAMVVGFATLPFTFEGKRRSAQANIALRTLREQCDAVLCFENDRLGDMVAPKAGIHQAFAAADHTISQSVRSIVNLIQRPGLIRIGFDDLLAALRSPNGRCLFGFGESDSDNRAHEALTLALKNPLMERGESLETAAHILVQIAGGPGLTLAEVEIVMKELGRHVNDETQILFGTAVDSRMGNRLSVTLISSLAAPGGVIEPAREMWHPALAKVPKEKPIWEQNPEAAPPAVAALPPDPEMVEAAPQSSPPPLPAETFGFEAEASLTEPQPPDAEPEPEAAPRAKRRPAPKVFPAPPEELAAPQPENVPVKEAKKVVAKQEVLQFEPITRGRFEKSEPTIVEGEDLDVPTFLRKGVRMK
jgi:cell division protein FtsZ